MWPTGRWKPQVYYLFCDCNYLWRVKSGLVKLGKPLVFSCKIVLETIKSTGKCSLRSMRKRAEKSFFHWLLFDQNSLSNNKGAPWWPLKRPSFIPSIVLDLLHLVDCGDLLFMILKRLNESIVLFFLLDVETTSLFPIVFLFFLMQIPALCGFLLYLCMCKTVIISVDFTLTTFYKCLSPELNYN